jgi:hypothetical protein
MKNRKNTYQTLILSIIAGIFIGFSLIKLNSIYIAFTFSALVFFTSIAHKQSIQYKTESPPSTSKKILLSILKIINANINIKILHSTLTIMMAMLIILIITNTNILTLKYPIILMLAVMLATTSAILLLNPAAQSLGLNRKYHSGSISLTGGVSIYIGTMIGFSLFMTPDTSSLTYLVCSSLIVALGVADDRKDLSPRFRLLAQSIVAILMCSGSGLSIQSLGNILGLGVVDLGIAGHTRQLKPLSHCFLLKTRYGNSM